MALIPVSVTLVCSSDLKWRQLTYERGNYLKYEGKYTYIFLVTPKSVENETTRGNKSKPSIVPFVCHQVQTQFSLNMSYSRYKNTIINYSCYFTFMWPYIVTNFFIIEPTRCTNSPNLLRHETLQFHPGPARKLSSNLYDIHQCGVCSE